MRETRAAFPTNSAGFAATAGTTSETSINAVLSVMPKTNLLYGTDFGAAR